MPTYIVSQTTHLETVVDAEDEDDAIAKAETADDWAATSLLGDYSVRPVNPDRDR